MWLAGSYLRSKPGRTSVLGGGIAAAAAAFTVLSMNAVALTVQISGRLPAAGAARAYDILVRAATPPSQRGDSGRLTRAADLTELPGGITASQYDMIRRLPGVQVAAPMTLVGDVALTVTIAVPVRVRGITSTRQLFAVTARLRSDDGLSMVTQRTIGSTGSSGSGLHTLAAAGPHTLAAAGPRPAVLWVPVGWTFLLPLVAVDPAAEARLLHLDRAVTRGRYLPSALAQAPGPVPVIMAGSIDDSDQSDISLTRLPASAARTYARGPSRSQIAALPGSATGSPSGTAMVTAAQAYGQLLGYLGRGATAQVLAYWTTSPASYLRSADGSLTPAAVASDAAPGGGGSPAAHPVLMAAAAGAQDVGFQSLTSHRARVSGSGAGRPAGAALQAVGAFDPGLLASSAITPSPYLGERLAGADARSRQLLGGQQLAADSNPAGYPSRAATLVMPLQDIGAFRFAGGYSGVQAGAPIGSIRVRVAGASGDNALSTERVRAVANEIVRATGLRVDVTLAVTAITRSIDLPAGWHGRPPLRVGEIWYRTDTSVGTDLDPRTAALAVLVLLVGVAFFVAGSRAALGTRVRDLATLRALGWPRHQVRRHLMQEFGLLAITSWMLAVLAAGIAEAAAGLPRLSWWLLLPIPAAVAATLAGIWWPVWRATAGEEDPAPAARRPPRLRRRAGQVLRIRQSAPSRGAVRGLVITAACAALGQELAVRWAFHGMLVGSLLGRPFWWQTDAVDGGAVLAILVMAIAAVADLDWVDAGERAIDMRTLKAIGWPAQSVAWLVARQAMLQGLAGGLAASVADVAGTVAVAHRLPASLLAVAVAVVGAGVAMSMVAAGLAAAARTGAAGLAAAARRHRGIDATRWGVLARPRAAGRG